MQTLLLSEIDILRSINHRYMIEMHEVYDSSKYVHLILPFYEGGELVEQIKIRPYTELETAVVMKKLLETLAHLHENLILHRDLKPENIILKST